ERTLAQALPGSTISASVGSSLSAPVEATLASTRGVRHVLVVRTALLAKPGVLKVDDTTSPDDYPSQVAVVACADLAAMLGTTLPCQAGRVLHVRFPRSFAQAAPPTGDLVATDGNGVALGAVALPAAVDVDLGRVGPALLLQSETAVDPSLLPRKALDAFGARLLITTDGQPATTERLRNVLDAAGILGASTLAEQLADQDRVVLGYQRATRLGLLLAVLVGGVGLLASSLDAVRARRRDLAALAAFGVPTGVLRRALLLEVLAPLLGCTALALGSGVFAAVAYLAADTFYRDEVGLPWRQWSGVGGLAVLVVLVVTAVTLPAAGRAARPSSLRVE
ncbi:MAG: putative integral rane protein, partial [Frankiales bacterium]|nr:putative integral rane protein [Frankiales bacterium]